MAPIDILNRNTVLGIDLGSNSLGTALIDMEKQSILFAGVRIFPAGVDGTDADLEKGKEVSRAAARRAARQARRQTDRRRRRMQRVFNLLQRYALLPSGDRSAVLPALEKELRAKYSHSECLPYALRAKALDGRLEPYELGRALYHLAQRRGFRSNRADSAKHVAKDEDLGDVNRGIVNLTAEIVASGARTLGEYLSRLNPHQTRIRGPQHYTGRTMFMQEFDAIWDAQAKHHPDLLTTHRRSVLHHAFFDQRQLKDQSRLVGPCELYPHDQNLKRAPLFTLEAQRLRVLGFVNNLRVQMDGGSDRKLSDSERELILREAESREKVTFGQIRKIPALRQLRFTIEKGGEKHVPGNITAARLCQALGSEWDAMAPEHKQALVEFTGDVRAFPTEEAFAEAAAARFGLSHERAALLAKVRLPDGYARFSSAAMRKILPHLEKGLTVEEAKKLEDPDYRRASEPLPLLPPVRQVLPEIRNPAVLRALTELRKTLNSIIRRYGKPAEVHIELARDLKRSRDHRQRASKQSRDRERLRQKAAAALREHDGVRFANPKPADVEKYLLAMEACWQCPYSPGRRYGFEDVFGDHPKVDVEHIIPRSRCLDNTFLNKTLTFRSTNAEKGRRTPREWLAQSDPDRFDRMLGIVRTFSKEFDVDGKLRRFAVDLATEDELLQDYTERQLQETRYASKLAARYIGVLYGGVDDADGRKRILTCAGGVTAVLRRFWELDTVLNRVPVKSRDDHRHHAVDAITVALSTRAQVKALADAFGDAEKAGRRRVVFRPPWSEFKLDVQAAIDSMPVSHRPMRRLSGALHEETNYGRPRMVDGKEVVHYRVPVTSLKNEEDIRKIVDPKVRASVLQRYRHLGGGGDRFSGEANWPRLETRTGKSLPIRKVRIAKVQKVQPLATDDPRRTRFVIPGSNHHMEVVAELNVNGEPARYGHHTVSMLCAMTCLRKKKPVVQRDHGPGCRFVCSLSEGDLIEAQRPADGARRIWRVRSVRARGSVVLSLASDARQKKDIEADRMLWDVGVNTLFSPGCSARKVLVSHLGEVLPAND